MSEPGLTGSFTLASPAGERLHAVMSLTARHLQVKGLLLFWLCPWRDRLRRIEGNLGRGDLEGHESFTNEVKSRCALVPRSLRVPSERWNM